jgi:hypothetical protein
MINRQLAVRDYEENHENAQLRQENARLLEENARLRAKLKDLSSAKPMPTPTQPDNVVPMSGAERANSTKPPAYYLKQSEPWEDYYNGRR